jgi:penicillin V acylase-like amidase (Ntn superfamily)
MQCTNAEIMIETLVFLQYLQANACSRLYIVSENAHVVLP